MAIKAVWKFPVTIDDEFEMTIPAGARVLSVQTQRGEPCMWPLVDPSAQRVTKRFRLAGTGHAIGGADGSGGLIADLRRAVSHGDTVPRMRAWLQAYDIAVGLRNVLAELPAQAGEAELPARSSCEDCGGFRCSGCDGRGVVFADESEAA